MVGLVRTAPWLVQAAWARFVDQRLPFPDDGRFKVHMVIEQRASADDRITLSNDRTDAFGIPLVEISWGVSPDDAADLTRAVDAFKSMWDSVPFSRSTGFKRSAPGVAEARLANGAGIFHPTGSTRMSGSSEDGLLTRFADALGAGSIAGNVSTSDRRRCKSHHDTVPAGSPRRGPFRHGVGQPLGPR